MDDQDSDQSKKEMQYANWLIWGSVLVAVIVLLVFFAFRLYVG